MLGLSEKHSVDLKWAMMNLVKSYIYAAELNVGILSGQVIKLFFHKNFHCICVSYPTLLCSQINTLCCIDFLTEHTDILNIMPFIETDVFGLGCKEAEGHWSDKGWSYVPTVLENR